MVCKEDAGEGVAINVGSGAAGDNNNIDRSSTNEDAASPTPSQTQQGRNGVPVTAEDLALREDICYQIFGDVGPLVRDFSCAWDHKVVMHGRMYVTERRLCFYANFFGLEAKMSLRHEDVARCSKGNSAIFIPNVVVVQDKSGKDFVFRNFWERDECHSLLEELRVKAQQDGDIASAATAAAKCRLDWDRDRLWQDKRTGESEQQEHVFCSPERTRVGNRPSTLPQNGDGSLSQERPRRRRSPSPPIEGSRPSSVPPLTRARATHAFSPKSAQRARASSMLFSSPAASSSALPPAQPTTVARGRAGARRPTGLGLAVLGGEHDTLSPRLPYGGGGSGGISGSGGGDGGGGGGGGGGGRRGRHHATQRSSPRQTAVITGAGRGGWGSPDPSATANGNGSASVSPAKGVGSVTAPENGRRANGGLAAVQSRPGCPGGDGGGGGGSGSNGVGGRGKQAGETLGAEVAAATATGAAKHAPDDEKQHEQNGEGKAQQQTSGRKVGLVRQGSTLWNMMKWDVGRAGAGEDPKADRKAMEEAAGEGGDHAEVATAELPVSVREFYERFFGDDALYGLPDFHISRGDWEVDAGEWQQTTEEAEQEGGENSGGGVAGAGEKRGRGGGGGGLTRAIRFKTPLHISFMSSPGQVRTLKRQRARFFGGAGCIVDTITTVEDRIPLSDNFHVEDRWIIRPAGRDSKECTATVTWRCVWHKFTVIKGLIEGKCRSDVQSFNIAFLEGMREHLVEKGGRVFKRQPSFRETLLSAAAGGRRASRDRSSSGRGRLLSYEDLDDGGAAAGSELDVEDEIVSQMGRLIDRYLPVVRVFSMCFILYISAFWVRYQLRGGGGVGSAAWRRGASGRAASKEELMHLYGEWGRSSLALLDVREETRRLSAQVVELGLASRGGGGFGSRGRGRSGEESRRDEMALQQLLRDIEEKVVGISQRADGALEALNTTASQIRDATACPSVEDDPYLCEEVCVRDAQGVAT